MNRYVERPHFLIDLNLMRLLVDSADIQRNDVVLEVGCGTGSLTGILAEKAGRVIAVELDGKLIEIAGNQLGKNKNIDFINSDILENKRTINQTVANTLKTARERNSGRLLLVANLPYSIASPLILNLITGPTITDAIFVTVQKEVAGRMIAVPNTKEYSILSIFLAATGVVKMIRKLKPSVFWPQPQVDSVMVSFKFDLMKARRIKNMELFGEIVSFFMSHRRKTLIACSRFTHKRFQKRYDWSEIFRKCAIDPKKRPDHISSNDYIDIANYMEKT